MSPRTSASKIPESTKWLTVAEAAQYARVGAAIIYTAAQKGALSGVKLTSAKKSPWRFTTADVDRWLERGRVHEPVNRKRTA